MKTRLTTLLIFIVSFAFNQELAAQGGHYEINGKIEGSEGVKFILQKSLAGKIVRIDSVVAVNGIFKISGGSVEYPELVNLVVPEKRKALSFFLENSVITISGKLDSLSNARVTGSKSQDEFSAFINSTRPLYERMTKLSNEYKAANETIMAEMKTVQKDFIKNNPGSFVSPLILSSMVKEMKQEEVELMINAMNPEVGNSPVAREIKSKLTAIKSVMVGQKAPDFTLNDAKGKPVSLSSKIGAKLLLVDFWAGWCAPCRQENPNVLKIYNEFKKKGFDIIGVSLDRTKDEWTNAIKDDKLPWTQVSDLSYFNSTAAKLYNVTAIPASFLLDENGMIVATNLRGTALYNKIKTILAPDTVTDIDGNVYNAITIGKQVWMLENLKTTKYRNGDPIPNITDSTQWKNLSTGAYCNYNDDEKNSEIYGRLYNWHAVNDSRNIAPKGWHVATFAEWVILVDYLGGERYASPKLRETGTEHWISPNRASTNESGFTALPGGYRNFSSSYFELRKYGSWHTATEKDDKSSWIYNVYPTDCAKGSYSKLHGRSVRCIKDNPLK